jgi:hypothetical protein
MIFRIVSTRARHQNNRGIDLGPESPPVINRKEPAMTIRASVFELTGRSMTCNQCAVWQPNCVARKASSLPSCGG